MTERAPLPDQGAIDAIEHVRDVAHSMRGGPRHGVTPREAMLYDKGFDDALDLARAAIRLTPDEERQS